MRLLACLVLTTLLASAFAQEGSSAQIEAVNALPNVEVQMMNDGGMFTAGDSAMETEATDSVVDPYSVIVDAVSDHVETVSASMSQDAEVSTDEAVVVEEEVQETPAPTLEVSDDGAMVVEEAVQETPAPMTEVTEDEAVVVEEEEVQVDTAPTIEVSEDEPVIAEEAVQEDPAPTLEVIEEEAAEADESLPEEDEPMLQPVAAATQAPMIAMGDVEPTLVVEPEPEPAPEDTSKDEKFAAPDFTVIEVEKPRQPTKEELKEVDKYNDAVDNIVNILNKRLTQKDALPLELDEEVLERLEEEVTTLPPTPTLPTPTTPATITEGSTAASVCPDRLVTKCATEKCKKKQKCQDKCERKGCLKKKKNKKNKKRKGDDKNKKNKKNQNNNNNNKNNKNKNNKNKKKNQNKRIRNKLFRPRVNSGNDYSRRQSKDLDLDEVEQARRKGDDNNVSKNKKPGNKGNKKRDNNRNKNNKKKNKNRSDLEAEAKDAYVPKSAEEGPLFSNNEELFSAPAVFMGFANIRRQGDVQVDLSGKWPTFITTVVMGPLNVLLTDPTALLKRSEVTTELTAQMHFTAKQARKRTKLKINEVTVEVPQDENISVLRSDLDLDLDVISAAQNEVSSAIDTDRVARIIHHELEAVFDEDNILQNLEDHPSLKP